MISLYSPLLSENQLTLSPSGDHAGDRSALPELLVRFLMLPSFSGTVNISPRASIIALFPVGDISILVICFDAFSQWGRIHGMSAFISMDNFSGFVLSGDKVYKSPPYSYIISPLPASRFLQSNVL